ncbi:MAG: OB-fold nucleic acid binding domain-containing protein, partial [Acidimicrobiaceae bacterium]|nr:OB-fold nucleic acid binding domain-containing protein [Acidimicrobiaceae bacterium]
VQVPDVNRSASDFTPVPHDDDQEADHGPGRIVYGLSAVRNVGEGIVERVIAERVANGPYASFVDFTERVDIEALNKRTIESLIKAGAFDSLGHPRKGLLQVHEAIIDMTVRKRREHEAGVMSLFGEQSEGPSFDDRPGIGEAEYERMQKLAHEKEMLGLYISDHPLKGMEARVRRLADCTIGDLASSGTAGDDAGYWSVGGVVTGLQRRWTRKGELMASFALEDLEDKIDVLVFPRAMSEHGPKLADDAVVVVRGRLDTREDTLRFFANDVTLVESTEPEAPLRVNLPLEHQNARQLQELRAVLRAHPGDSPVELVLDARRMMRLPDDFAVDTANGLPAELRELLGAGAIAGP